MYFEWDDSKNRLNLHKHGIDFAQAVNIFGAPYLLRVDTRDDYGEDRCVATGLLNNRLITVVFVEIEADRLRIISARKANREEREHYAEVT